MDSNGPFSRELMLGQRFEETIDYKRNHLVN